MEGQEVGGIEKKSRCCFVILHYGNNKDLTLNAIKSIKELDDSEYADIIVVCNGEEFDISYDVQALDAGIRVIVLKENTGFSKGNNVGYIEARRRNKYKFIVFINNDIEIRQKDFINVLNKEYEQYKFYCAGPDVFTPYTGYHSNPLREHIANCDDIDRIIDNKEKLRESMKNRKSLSVIKQWISDTKRTKTESPWIFKLWRKIRHNDKPYKCYQENVVLQGSCLIVSKDFIEKNELAFEPEVFLYFEEEYLANKCKDNKWNSVYLPTLQVYHMHKRSSGFDRLSYKAYTEKEIARIDRYISSAKEYKSWLEKRENTKKEKA